MSSLFSKPKVAEPAPVMAPPDPPTQDDALQNQEAEDEARKRKGRAATVLTGTSGAPISGTSIGTKALLGS